MRIVSYIDPQRSLLPATGVGRHMNNMLLGLASRPGIEVSTLCSSQFVDGTGRLSAASPLRDLPIRTFPAPIQIAERTWKLLRRPNMDHWVKPADWLYLPEEGLFPVRSARVAVTVHDCHAFETNLPWSNTDVHRRKRRRWSMWMKPMLDRAAKILAVSDFTRRRLMELFRINEERIVVVGNGVEPAFFEVAGMEQRSLHRPTTDPYVLVVGGLSPRKGGDHVLAIASELHRRRSDLKIVIAGRSDPRLARIAAAHSNIMMLGPVADADLPALLRASAGLLFLSEYEGFGIPAIEAMAAGVPAIVSNRSALPETAGDAGIIVEPLDVPAVVEVLYSLCRNPRAFDRHVELGHRRAARFHWSNCVSRLVAALN